MDLRGRLIFQVVSAKLPKHTGWPDPADGETGGEIKTICKMKKLVLFTVLSVFLATSDGFSISLASSCPEFWVKFGFTFHRPKLDCKQGFGLCMDVSWGIDGMGAPSENVCPVRGFINDQNQLVVEIREDELAKYEKGSTLPYFKGRSHITLEDPYTLSKDVARQLGTSSFVTIKAGTYPVTFSDQLYTVIFQL
jgi:hypothetical protein